MTGTVAECLDCCGTGVNVYADDFDPARPPQCPCCHAQPVAA